MKENFKDLKSRNLMKDRGGDFYHDDDQLRCKINNSIIALRLHS